MEPAACTLSVSRVPCTAVRDCVCCHCSVSHFPLVQLHTLRSASQSKTWMRSTLRSLGTLCTRWLKQVALHCSTCQAVLAQSVLCTLHSSTSLTMPHSLVTFSHPLPFLSLLPHSSPFHTPSPSSHCSLTCTQAYLEDFHRYCKELGGTTAEVMCPLLEVKGRSHSLCAS